MAEYNTHFHPDVHEQNVYYEEQPFVQNKNIRSMPQGNDRLAALRDLGATFNEGQHRVTKIATPTGTPKLPTFVDAGQIEVMMLILYIYMLVLIDYCYIENYTAETFSKCSFCKWKRGFWKICRMALKPFITPSLLCLFTL
jgi:hypothetical protein